MFAAADRHADAGNLFAESQDEVAHKLAVLRGHCDAVGRRDESTILKTIVYHQRPSANGVDTFVAEMADYAALGIDTVIVMPPGDAPAA